MIKISLRNPKKDDIQIFYDQQLDLESNFMAAFTRQNPNDWESFNQHWEQLLLNDEVIIKTIQLKNEIVGYVSSFYIQNERNIGYWIGKSFWGRGIATNALKEYLKLVNVRPLFARVAFDNMRSIRVLENCGFVKSGEDKYYANARGKEITEYIYRLN